MGPQINVIEDKRKFDIMEFVSFQGKVGRSLLMEIGGKREILKGPSSALSPPRLDPRCCVWWKPRLHISSRAMRS